MKFVWRGDRAHAFDDSVEPIERIKGYRYSISAFTGLTGFRDEEQGAWRLSFLEMHLDRILGTADELHLEHDLSRDDLREAIFETIRLNRPTDPFYVHIGVRSGECGIRPVRGGPGVFSVFLEGTGGYHPPEGIHAVILGDDHDPETGRSQIKYPRPQPYHLKLNSNYIHYGELKTAAKELYKEKFEAISGEGAADGIVLGWQPGCREHFVTECTTSNLIIVDADDKLTLLPTGDFILDGITMRLAEQLVTEFWGLKTERRRVWLSELREGVEKGTISVFETGSSAGLTAIRSVDGIPVKKWSRFDELHDLYERARRGQVPEWADRIVACEDTPPKHTQVIEHRETERDVQTGDVPFAKT